MSSNSVHITYYVSSGHIQGNLAFLNSLLEAIISSSSSLLEEIDTTGDTWRGKTEAANKSFLLHSFYSTDE